MQLLSVLTRCRKGCEATGAINKPVDERPNAYQEVANVMQKILGESIEVDPADIKLAVMTALYGSKAEPKKLFTGYQLDVIENKCFFRDDEVNRLVGSTTRLFQIIGEVKQKDFKEIPFKNLS